MVAKWTIILWLWQPQRTSNICQIHFSVIRSAGHSTFDNINNICGDKDTSLPKTFAISNDLMSSDKSFIFRIMEVSHYIFCHELEGSQCCSKCKDKTILHVFFPYYTQGWYRIIPYTKMS